MSRAFILRAVILVPAVAIIAVSFAMNLYFWHQTMRADPAAQALYMLLSATAGLFKIAIPAALAATALTFRQRPGLAALFAFALAFDVLSGLGFSALTRGEAMAARETAAAPVADLRRQLAEAERDRAKVADARTTARIKTELEAAKRKASACETRKEAQTDACTRVAALEAEQTDAVRRDALSAKIDDLSAAIVAAGPERDSDPQFSAVALALKPLGLDVDKQTISKVFGLLVVLLIELGGTVALRSAFEPRPVASEVPAPTPAPVPAPLPAARAPRSGRSRTDLVELLRSLASGKTLMHGASVSADGWLYVSQRDLGASVGLSASTIGRKLADMEKAGTVQTRRDAMGTGIKLLAPGISVKTPSAARA